jgi:hypothetical protein
MISGGLHTHRGAQEGGVSEFALGTRVSVDWRQHLRGRWSHDDFMNIALGQSEHKRG